MIFTFQTDFIINDDKLVLSLLLEGIELLTSIIIDCSLFAMKIEDFLFLA